MIPPIVRWICKRIGNRAKRVQRSSIQAFIQLICPVNYVHKLILSSFFYSSYSASSFVLHLSVLLVSCLSSFFVCLSTVFLFSRLSIYSSISVRALSELANIKHIQHWIEYVRQSSVWESRAFAQKNNNNNNIHKNESNWLRNE